MGSVPSKTARPLKKPTINEPQHFSTSSSLSNRTRQQRTALRRLQKPLRTSTAPFRSVAPQIPTKTVTKSVRRTPPSKDPRIKEQRSASIRQRINGLCLKALGIPGSGTVKSVTSQGWTFWDFKQSDGHITRAIVVAVDGGYVHFHPPRSSIGVWFGNGNGEFGSPYNISRRVTSQAPGSGEAELVAATEGLLRLYGIYSSRVRENDLHAIIKTDLMAIAEKMNLYISTRKELKFKHQVAIPVYWKNLRRALELVESLGVKVGFWHVLRDSNRFADALATHALQQRNLPFLFASFQDVQDDIDLGNFVSVVGKRRSMFDSTVAKSRSIMASVIAGVRIWLSSILTWRNEEKCLATQNPPETQEFVPHVCSQCGGFHLESKYPTLRRLRLERPCFPWNHSASCKEDPCPYPHKCSICKGEHRKKECPVYDPTLEACGQWNNKESRCVNESCRKQHICAYCAGPHTIASCPIRPPGPYWRCVNEVCPTRLLASQSHCSSCGTPRPGSAFSSHTDGPKEDRYKIAARPEATRKQAAKLVSNSVQTQSIAKQVALTPGYFQPDVCHQKIPKIKTMEKSKPRKIKKKISVTSTEDILAKKVPQPQLLPPQLVVPIYQGPLPTLVISQAQPKSYYSSTTLLRNSAFQNLPRQGKRLRK